MLHNNFRRNFKIFGSGLSINCLEVFDRPDTGPRIWAGIHNPARSINIDNNGTMALQVTDLFAAKFVSYEQHKLQKAITTRRKDKEHIFMTGPLLLQWWSSHHSAALMVLHSVWFNCFINREQIILLDIKHHKCLSKMQHSL